MIVIRRTALRLPPTARLLSLFVFFFLFIIIVVVTLVPRSAAASPCTAADRAAVDSNGYPHCIRVGFLGDSLSVGGIPISPTQQYWANTLPQRVWSNVRRNLEVRNISVEEVKTNLDWETALAHTENGTYDMFVANFWILAARLGRVDFSIPYLREGWGLLHFRPPPPKSQQDPMLNWAAPFTGILWACIFAVFIAGAIVLWICEFVHLAWGGHTHALVLRPDEDLVSGSFTMIRHNSGGAYLDALQSSFSHSFGSIFGTSEANPRSFGGWLVSWSLHAFVWIVLAAYTANLASFLTLARTKGTRTSAELLTKPIITVNDPEFAAMFESAANTTYISQFTSRSYLDQFLKSNATSAALPELDLREITLQHCDFAYVMTDMSVSSGFIFNQQSDAILNVKMVMDEAMLQFSDFGILSNWVDSGLPPDSCNDAVTLANQAMGLNELAGAFVFALAFFGTAVVIGLLTMSTGRRLHHNISKSAKKLGDATKKLVMDQKLTALRSDDIDLAEEAIQETTTAIEDAKRAAATMVHLMSLRTTEAPSQQEQDAAHCGDVAIELAVPPATAATTTGRDGKANAFDASASPLLPPTAAGDNNSSEHRSSRRRKTPVRSKSELSKVSTKFLNMFLVDGIVKAEDDKTSELKFETSSDEEEDESKSNNNNNNDHGDGKNEKRHDHNHDNNRKTLDDGHAATSGRISAQHLARIRGSSVAITDALLMAEDALNRAGRRKYCEHPCQRCVDQSKFDKRTDAVRDIQDEPMDEHVERMDRERKHLAALVTHSRIGARTSREAAEAAVGALRSSLVVPGRRRAILEVYMRRAFRASAFLILLVASATRRVANEAIYVTRMRSYVKKSAISELAEMSALIARETEEMIHVLVLETKTARPASGGWNTVQKGVGSVMTTLRLRAKSMQKARQPFAATDKQQEEDRKNNNNNNNNNNNTNAKSKDPPPLFAPSAATTSAKSGGKTVDELLQEIDHNSGPKNPQPSSYNNNKLDDSAFGNFLTSESNVFASAADNRAALESRGGGGGGGAHAIDDPWAKIDSDFGSPMKEMVPQQRGGGGGDNNNNNKRNQQQQQEALQPQSNPIQQASGGGGPIEYDDDL